jgi:hypothetical protein
MNAVCGRKHHGVQHHHPHPGRSIRPLVLSVEWRARANQALFFAERLFSAAGLITPDSIRWLYRPQDPLPISKGVIIGHYQEQLDNDTNITIVLYELDSTAGPGYVVYIGSDRDLRMSGYRTVDMSQMSEWMLHILMPKPSDSAPPTEVRTFWDIQRETEQQRQREAKQQEERWWGQNQWAQRPDAASSSATSIIGAMRADDERRLREERMANNMGDIQGETGLFSQKEV